MFFLSLLTKLILLGERNTLKL